MEFITLVLAHCLADYPLQPEFIALNKGKNMLLLVAHCWIWAGVVGFAGVLLGYSFDRADFISLFTIHFIADYLKAKPLLWYKDQVKFKPLREALWIDQSIHMIQLLVFALTNSPGPALLN